MTQDTPRITFLLRIMISVGLRALRRAADEESDS